MPGGEERPRWHRRAVRTASQLATEHEPATEAEEISLTDGLPRAGPLILTRPEAGRHSRVGICQPAPTEEGGHWERIQKPQQTVPSPTGETGISRPSFPQQASAYESHCWANPAHGPGHRQSPAPCPAGNPLLLQPAGLVVVLSEEKAVPSQSCAAWAYPQFSDGPQGTGHTVFSLEPSNPKKLRIQTSSCKFLAN